MQEFLEYISDYRLFKKEFFEGIKNLSMFKFRDLGTKAEELLESEDNFSSIGGVDGPDTLKVPEKFKQESILIERMINFYVEYVG